MSDIATLVLIQKITVRYDGTKKGLDEAMKTIRNEWPFSAYWGNDISIEPHRRVKLELAANKAKP